MTFHRPGRLPPSLVSLSASRYGWQRLRLQLDATLTFWHSIHCSPRKCYKSCKPYSCSYFHSLPPVKVICSADFDDTRLFSHFFSPLLSNVAELLSIFRFPFSFPFHNMFFRVLCYPRHSEGQDLRWLHFFPYFDEPRLLNLARHWSRLLFVLPLPSL